jgi:hypothetical protein
MKKLTFFVGIGAFLAIWLWAATPVAAWNAIQGTVYAGDGSRWTYGGTVTVFDQDFDSCGTSPLVTGNPATNGNYAISIAVPVAPCNPTNGQPLYIVVEINPGPGGTPSTQFAQITQFPINSAYIQNFNTGTSPTAVTLASLASTSNTSSALPYLIVVVAVLLGSATTIAVRRRTHLN